MEGQGWPEVYGNDNCSSQVNVTKKHKHEKPNYAQKNEPNEPQLLEAVKKYLREMGLILRP